MYRVMPQDPDAEGSYREVKGAPNLEAEEPFEIIFKVPRLESHVQDRQDKYTIVLPRYVAEEMRQQAAEEGGLHEPSMDPGHMTGAPTSPRRSYCAGSLLCARRRDTRQRS
jgi:hypothetical protein